jgi:hypothetical protein
VTHAEIRAAREIVRLLAVVWIERLQRYLAGWSDAAVARRAGVRASIVADLRAKAFGPGTAASPEFRWSQAILLVDQRFDATAALEHRDQAVEQLGEAGLLALQEQGTAPAAGAWDAEWSDDRVAHLAGVAPEIVNAIRSSIPWIPPDARAEARRRRLVSRIDPARDPLARAVRLMDFLDPATRQPYTAEAMFAAALEAGQTTPPRTEAARRRELALVKAATAIAWHLTDATGRLATPSAIARQTGLAHPKVLGILHRLGPEALAREGRPSRLTTAICERVERADPRRLDRRSLYAWLIAWIWQGDDPASLRTVKGWRAAGVADNAAAVDSLAARFDRAVASLLERATDAPVLPTAEELQKFTRGADARHVADSLGATLEQVAEARRLARRKAR